MLNQDTKRKIDSARQILVGKVPDPKAQVEQITTALIYKFMDDMDKEAQELGGKARFFTNGYEKYAWTKLMDAKLGGHDRLDLYIEAITSLSQNPHIPQLFRDIFKDTFLPYRNPETLSLFLKEVNGFSYDNSEDLGNAFEYLLSILGSQGDAGQFRTPRHIIDFIVDAVNPKKDETICDPACGTAGFLISAYKHILKQHEIPLSPPLIKGESGKATGGFKPLTPDERKDLMNNFVGYDISPDMVRLSKVNLYLHGFPSPTIFEYDTLSSEEKWDESFDVMLANPPFMSPKGGIRPHKRFSVQANRSEVLFVDYILEHLRPKGRAGIIVPEGVIFQSAGAYKQLRKMLVEDGLMAVVSLPAGVFNPYAGVKTSILLFDNEIAKKTKNILFLKIQNDGYDLGAQRREHSKNDLPLALEIIRKYKDCIQNPPQSPFNKGGSDEVAGGFILSESEKQIAHLVAKEKIAETGDYNLSGDRYKEIISFTNQKWPIVELKELCTLQRGLTYSTKELGTEDVGVPFYNLKSIKREGGSQKNDFKYFTGEIKEKHFVTKGDLLIALTDLTPTSELIGSPKLIIDNERAAYSADLAKIIFLDEQIIPSYLNNLLRSENYRQYIITFSHGANVKHLQAEGFYKFKIPLPPIEVQKEIVDQIEAKQQTIDYAKTIIENLENERHHFYQDLKKLDCGQVKLGDYVNFVSGLTLSIPDSISENGTPIISINNITEDGRITLKGIRNIGLPNKKSINYLKKGDLLFNWRNGSKHLVGKTGYFDLPGQYVFASFLLGIRTDEKILLPKFLWHLLNSYRASGKYMQFMRQNVNGLFNREELKILEIPLPSIDIQAKLVDQMYKENEIINANRQLVEIYEQKISDVLNEI